MKMKVKKISFEAIKIAVALVLVFPVLIAIIVSFQSLDEVYKLPYSLTMENPTWEHFAYALKSMKLSVYMKNTLVQILVCVPCQIITSLLTAYAFSYFQFPFKNLLFTVIVASMMIPRETVTITIFKMVAGWNMVDTYAGLTIVGLISVGAVFLFRQSMLSVPISLWEAAKMDGCGEMRFFAQILVPLCKSIIVAQTLLAVIGCYNDYLWPMLVTTKDTMRTIQTGIVYLTGVAHPGRTMAAVLIVLIIPIIMFIFGIDRIMEGVTAGAVKN